METDEQILIRQAQLGDHEAFRQLVTVYSPLLHRLARVLLKSASQAEDAVQESWLDAWRGLSTYKAGRPVRPWLLTITTNRCRRTARTTLPTEAFDEETQTEAMVFSPGETDWQHPFEDNRLGHLVESLSDDQQRILALRFFVKMELEEIAQATASPLGTVKSRLHRALSTLRTQLAEQPGLQITNAQKE